MHDSLIYCQANNDFSGRPLIDRTNRIMTKIHPPTPPRWVDRLLERFGDPYTLEEVQGDLQELFPYWVHRDGPSVARRRYCWAVLRLLRPFARRSRSSAYPSPPLLSTVMFKNYLVTSLRNLRKNRLFSLINISGMAVSVASFLLISLFVYDDLQYDRHISDLPDKYRVYAEHFSADAPARTTAMVPPAIGPTLATESSQVVSYVRFLNNQNSVLFKAGDQKLTETRGGFADPAIFDMFSLDLLEGDARTALQAPDAMAISKTLARKYFGDEPAFGKTIDADGQNWTVTAVFEDFPERAHLHLDYFLSLETYTQSNPERMQLWGWNQFHTYVQLQPGADAAEVEAGLQELVRRHTTPGDEPRSDNYYIPHLMPVEEVHLYASNHLWDIAERGNIQTIYMLLTTAVFILVIAILNFVNLSTAQALSRSQEVGVRKVMGALRRQLILQFISESVIVTFVALCLGVLIARLTLPALNALVGKSIPAGIFLEPGLLMGLLAAAFFIGWVAGAYPAFYISGYQPLRVLNKQTAGRPGGVSLRKSLVVFQFVLSFCLIIASLVISGQYTFLRTQNMGFDQENLIVLRLRGEMSNKPETAKQAFSGDTKVISATLGYGLPGEAYAGDVILTKGSDKLWHTSVLTVDEDYAETLGLEVIAGRDFSKDMPSDAGHAFVISEAAAKMLGYVHPEDALQHELQWPRWDAPDSLKEGRVIGVVRDFNLNSLHEDITPVVLHVFPFAYNTLTLRVRPGDLPATIARLETTWKQFNSDWPFEYKFLDDNFDRLYKTEAKLAALFRIFTAFTIFVACFGLFGLVVYSTTQKYREISIRKVLGASEHGLVIQLTRQYLVLLGLAFMVAVPLSYYATRLWLQDFAFHIEITPLLFVKAAVFILLLALLTVGLQAIKAARTNPVEAMRAE